MALWAAPDTRRQDVTAMGSTESKALRVSRHYATAGRRPRIGQKAGHVAALLPEERAPQRICRPPLGCSSSRRGFTIKETAAGIPQGRILLGDPSPPLSGGEGKRSRATQIKSMEGGARGSPPPNTALESSFFSTPSLGNFDSHPLSPCWVSIQQESTHFASEGTTWHSAQGRLTLVQQLLAGKPAPHSGLRTHNDQAIPIE